MNTRLLRRIAKHILNEPKRLVMGDWVQRKNPLVMTHAWDAASYKCRKQPFGKCGTAACIAGWAVLLSAKNPNRVQSAEGDNISRRAARLLGLRRGSDWDWPGSQAGRLFAVDSWPDQFSDAYSNAKTPAGKARIAARRIEHFIKTGGRE